MKSVENILGYIREAVSLKKICEIVQGNMYPKIFETYLIFRQQKIESKPMSGVIIR